MRTINKEQQRRTSKKDGELLRDIFFHKRVRRSAAQSGSSPLFGGGNATRTAPLRTEPTRTLRWKRAIRENHGSRSVWAPVCVLGQSTGTSQSVSKVSIYTSLFQTMIPTHSRALSRLSRCTPDTKEESSED